MACCKNGRCGSTACGMVGKCLADTEAGKFIGLDFKPGAVINVEDLKGTAVIVEDFSGKVDGKGVKGVMASPKSGVQMIDPAFVQGIGDVLTYGAKKYAEGNWMRGMSWTVVFGAVFRHCLAWFSGEDRDSESGLPHLHHAACSLMFLGFYSRKEEHAQFDDRRFK